MPPTTSLAPTVLAFWRAIEYLTPAAPEEAGRKTPPHRVSEPRHKEASWDVGEDSHLPWSEGLRHHYAPTAKEVWFFVVTVGYSPVDDAMDELREMLGHLPDDPERPGGGGEMALASLVTDAEGRFAGSLAAAPFPWAMGRLRAGGHPKDLDGFEEFEAELGQSLDTLLCGDTDRDGRPFPISVEKLRSVCAMVEAMAGWGPRKALKLLARVKPVKLQVREGFPLPEIEPEILGSFIAGDLSRVGRAVAAGDMGPALAAYILGRPAGMPETDVTARPEAAAPWLSPRLYPPGRWPSKPVEQLVVAQQMAVNAALAKLGGRAGLFSVNGPPGTGKTTLLRDVVAAIIVERAKVLCGFATPNDAFGASRDLGKGRVWALDERLKGFEMVVASSNNGAVENVTAELPGEKAIDPDRRKGWDHFSAVARTLLDPEPGEALEEGKSSACWGLIAAVLGNRRNRKRFIDRFWWAEPGRKKFDGKVTPDHWQSFKTALFQPAKVDWRAAKAAFEKALAEAERSMAPARALEEALARREGLAAAQAQWRDFQRQVDGHEALRPSWLHLLLRPWAWWGWWRQRCAFGDRFDAMTRTLLDLGCHVRGRGLGAMIQRLDALGGLAREAEGAIAQARLAFTGLAADESFFAQPPELREKLAPWIDEASEEARKRCFMAALDLHRAFLLGAREKVRDNIGLATDMMKGKPSPHDCGESLGDLWSSLFLAVPVVSTTFASFARLFEGMGRESLGWLLVDEAGQATPQAAAGAIWRSRRALVIGDPLQIEPVVPLPLSVIKAMEDSFKLDHKWHPVEHSAQVLADRANPLGGRIGKDWVGSPLRVHRRCSDPMFRVANAIAYDNLMVHGDVPMEAMPLGPSRWLDVGGLPEGEGHYIPAQGEAALELLRQAQAAGALDQVFVISPFRTVAQGMRDAAHHAGLPNPWIRRKVGTVHTFQGKEALMVILVLGGHPNRPGALDWAASRPNLLNVALTRAKRAVYVVGDRGAWRTRPHFRELDEVLG